MRAGIAGVLFGPGNGGTEVYDRRHDGITNHPPISTYGCDRCNTQASVYPDDDGGYLRIFVGAYYKNGTYSLSGTGTPPGTPPVARAGARSTAGTTPPPV